MFYFGFSLWGPFSFLEFLFQKVLIGDFYGEKNRGARNRGNQVRQ